MMRNFLIVGILFFAGTAQAAQRPEGSCSPKKILSAIFDSHQEIKVQALLDEAVKILKHDSQANLDSLSQKLIQAQADILKQKGIPFRLGPKNAWIDLLPDPKGSPLSQLAYHLDHNEPTHHLLRYHPAMLFEDSSSIWDSSLYHRNRAIYLTHHDLLNGPESDYFKQQISSKDMYQDLQRKLLQREDPEEREVYKVLNRPFETPLSEKDYTTDWHRDPLKIDHHSYGTETSELRIHQLLYDYLKKTPDLAMVTHPKDPIVSRLGPFKRMGRESYQDALIDLNGVTKTVYNENGFRVSELSGPAQTSEKTVYDNFLTDAVRDRHHDKIGTYRRALVLPDGRMLVHMSGRPETQAYFNSYLDFLEKIYTDPKGLNLSKSTFKELRKKSLEFSQRSELITRTKTKNWLNTRLPEDVNGGLILVKSENPGQKLPMLEAHPNLKLHQPEDEVWVEAGRLGSLTGEETIQFLKVAGASLHYQYPKKTVRIICEGNQSRAKLFKKFGFEEASTKITDKSYYPDGSDLVLQVTLENFLKHVLK
jgi:hypothetical protein